MIKIPLVGAAYQMQAKSIDTQNCINWYPQAIEYPNGTRVSALMPTAGLKKLFQGDSAAVRALYVLSNGNLLVVIGKKLYHTPAKVFNLQYIGVISGLSQVSIADNGLVAMLVNGTYTYSLDLTTLTLTKLTGSNIPRSTSVAFLDGRFILNKIGTGRFVWTALYSTDIDPLSFATAEASPDPITAIVAFNRELWMFGSQTVERYYSTGTNDLPYARLSGGTMPFGCVTPNSISRFTGGFIWLAVSEFGGDQIVVSDGGSPSRVSTHAIEEDIGTYARTDDAIAYAYQFEGHVFYVISFPTANVTWCYDASTGLWHQRSWTNEQGFHERHRSQCHAFFRNMHIVGDHRNGKLYALDKNTYTDDGDLITRERTCPAVITDGAHVRYNRLEIVCEAGFNLSKPVISCSNATSAVRFSSFTGLWGAELDGVAISSNNIQQYFKDQSTIFNSDYSSFFYINNIDETAPHRVLLKPILDANYSIDQSVQNPSIIEHRDGSVSFCLSEFTPAPDLFRLRVAEFPAGAPFPPEYEAWRPTFDGSVSVRIVGSPTGTTIDWGDGSAPTVITTTGTTEFIANHTYSSPNHILTVTSDDYLSRIKVVSSSITEVISYGDLKAHNMRFAIDSLMYVPAVFSQYVTDMTAFFFDCYALNDPNVSNYGTSNVTSLEFAMGNCALFNQPINWNTSAVTNMWGAFNSMLAFNQPVNHLNVSNVTTFLATFEGCKRFNQTFASWSSGSAFNMERMIKGCIDFNQDLSRLCVTNIPSYPTEFSVDSGIAANNAFHPVWGTCPA